MPNRPVKNHCFILQVGDESYASYKAEKDGILESLARRAKVSLVAFPLHSSVFFKNIQDFSFVRFTGVGGCIQQA
jgi:hypothetical protein